MPNEIIEGYRLSPQQEHLWLLQGDDPRTPYRALCAINIEGPLDPEILRAALHRVVARQEILRTTFHVLPAMTLPVQVIGESSFATLDVHDLGGEEPLGQARRLEELLHRQAGAPFHFAEGPLMNLSLAVLSADRHVLVVSLPALCTDMAALNNLTREISLAYAEGSGEAELATAPMQYADVAEILHELIESEGTRTGREYWRNKNFPPLREMKLAGETRPVNDSGFNPQMFDATIAAETCAGIEQLARQFEATTEVVLLALWQTLIHRLTGENDIIVNTLYDGRSHAELYESFGLFARHLPVYTSFAADTSFSALLPRLEQATREMRGWQEYFTNEHLSLFSGEANVASFFPFAFEYAEAPPERTCAGVSFSIYKRHAYLNRFKLNLSGVRHGDTLGLTFHYDASLYRAEDIGRLSEQFRRLLASALEHPTAPVSRLEILSDVERRQVLQTWNETTVDFSRHPCIHLLFEEQAARTPDDIAVIFEEQQLTYEALNRKANQLAHYLRTLGVGPEVPVGIAMNRSLEMLVGLLAVFKAGGAYVPLDPAYPRERLDFMLKDSAVEVLLTQISLIEALPAHRAQVVCLDTDWETIASAGEQKFESGVGPDNLAYVIYTSGSTGRPKGVMIPHRAICNRLLWMQSLYPLASGDRVLQKTAFSFDASVWELFVPLLAGAQLVMARPGGQQDSAYLVEVIQERQITILQLVPSMLRVMLEEKDFSNCTSLRRVYCGGESLPVELERKFRERMKANLHNLYGPTEASIDATHRLCDGESRGSVVPIGRPIANLEMYVLDAQLAPVPVGVAGELYIGGVGVGRGYLRRAELTAERFIPHPYSGGAGGERLYRTGDVGRHLANGEIEYLGRIDQQVKVRGYRIELGEIEAALVSEPQVREAVVVVREDTPGDQRLVAYLVAHGQATLSDVNLRRHVQEQLPEYMLPSVYVQLEEMPHTPNGKLDRQSLPLPEASQLARAGGYVEPRTATEEIVAGMWEGLLQVERVGRADNFFELGGHSLLATQVISWVREVFRTEIALRGLFESPTVAGLSELIDRGSQTEQGLSVTPIERATRDQELPLSFSQQRLWFLNQLEPGNVIYHLLTAVQLKGRLNISALEQSFNEIVRRHESLRTTFQLVRQQPVEVIHETPDMPLRIVEMQHLSESEKAREVERALADAAERPFDLVNGPLLRASLLRRDETDHVFVLVMHHIISDGWSMGVFIREIVSLYAQYADGAEAALPELPIQYSDYAFWQQKSLREGTLQTQLDYWKRQLAGAPAVLELPTDRARPAVQSFRGARRSIILPPALREALKALSRQQGVTLFMTLLAAFQTLLSRYTGQRDIVVGTPIAGRNRIETEGLIGYFANTLVLRTELAGDPSFVELLARVREVALEAYAHQDLPFEKLVEELQPARALSHNPLFQVLFSLQNTPERAVQLNELTWSQLGFQSSTARFDLAFDMSEGPEGLGGECEYNTDLFDAATIERLLGHFQKLLESITADPEQRISQISFLTPPERRLMLDEWNPAPSNPTQARCLHELFEAHAAQRPAAIAVVYEQERLSFAELNQRANQLAHHLLKLGVGPEVQVGICIERGAEMMVGLLAILKAGGAYVPLDPSYPAERLSFMLRDAGAPVLLTSAHLLPKLPPRPGLRIICLDTERELISRESAENPHAPATPDNLAYMIYTSGSTGLPKGVQITHRSVISLLEVARPVFNFDEHDVWTLFHSYAFDFSVWEIWGCLLHGGRLIITPLHVTQSPELFYDLLCAEQVTVLNQTPSALRQLSAAREKAASVGGAESLRLIVCGGEALPRDLVSPLLAWSVPVWNFYGPTEATVWASANLLGSFDAVDSAISIGRPLANTQLYILDEQFEPTPIGVAGELYIGGVGLARGYFARPELTAERFIPHPFSREAGARLYRTGDLGHYFADGKIEYLGRIDQQVKVRGFRIELGEIEAALSRNEAVEECAVAALEDEGGGRLVAYLVSRNGETVQSSRLRSYLREQLPEYMLPSVYVQLEEMPHTPNGKLDRQALPAPEASQLARAGGYVEPRTATEEIVAGMWEGLLQVERVGRADNFFELGGHSLLATQVISWARESFGVEIALRSLFESPTVAGLAELIEREQRACRGLQAPPLLPVSRAQGLPLSFAQQRLWFLSQLEPASANYNLPTIVRLRGYLDLEAFERTVNEIVRRHEVLRTSISAAGREPRQFIAPHTWMELPLIDLSALPATEREAGARQLAAEQAQHPFDLTHAPLLRVSIVRLAPDEHLILFTMHHIISDAWSMGLLVSEVADLYTAFSAAQPSPLPDLAVQYADYAVWQREWLQGATLDAQLAYWREQLAGAPALLALPSDRPRPLVPSYRGARHDLVLGTALSVQLKELSHRQEATLFMTLLAAFQMLMSYYTGQTDVVVGTDVANRNLAETERLIGFFVNQLVLRTRIDEEESFQQLLKQVRDVALNAYTYQDVPFEKVVEEIRPDRSLKHMPLFQVKLTLQNARFGELKLPGLELQPEPIERRALDLDLYLEIVELPDGLSGYFLYSMDLFDAATIARMSSRFATLLAAIAARPESTFSELKQILIESDQREQAERQRKRAEGRLKKFNNIKPVGVSLTPSKTDKQ